MPCHAVRARQLLKKGKAAVFRFFPFTIILHERDTGALQPLELKVDPGSKTTGLVLVLHGQTKNFVVFAAHLKHRGAIIKAGLDHRRSIRRSRRQRKTRYRALRFHNRSRSQSWLPPSLISRVHNVTTWTQRLLRCAPVSVAAVETARFNVQKIVNPEIVGIEYQQGELFGYEIREYLLEKWGRECSYCHLSNIPLQIEHIVPRSRSGSNRISNLCLACISCNQKKGTLDVEDFLKNKQKLLEKIKSGMQTSLKDAAAVNTTRFVIGNAIKACIASTTFWSGGRTKFNRMQQGYEKAHWIDAACVGLNGNAVFIPSKSMILVISAQGHGDRQVCFMNKYGFPRSRPSITKVINGFKTGDYVKAYVTRGKKKGYYKGKVSIRSSGFFNIMTHTSIVQGISYRSCSKLHSSDGYNYSFLTRFPPYSKEWGIQH